MKIPRLTAECGMGQAHGVYGPVGAVPPASGTAISMMAIYRVTANSKRLIQADELDNECTNGTVPCWGTSQGMDAYTCCAFGACDPDANNTPRCRPMPAQGG
ncbi:hypothetical protein [Streptomyces mirabilis]|uniref:hypothetical protein n=2 Tax=Streptomyces mirabilis TaxID=68239 RepID=UPI003662773E